MANYNSLIRLSEVQRRTGSKQVKIGSRAIAFVESEIDEWIERCILESRDEVA